MIIKIPTAITEDNASEAVSACKLELISFTIIMLIGEHPLAIMEDSVYIFFCIDNIFLSSHLTITVNGEWTFSPLVGY